MGKRAFELGGDGGVCVDEVRRAVKRLCTLEGTEEARAGIAPSDPAVEAGRVSPALEAPPCPPLGGSLPLAGAAHAENWAMRRPRSGAESSEESQRWRGPPPFTEESEEAERPPPFCEESEERPAPSPGGDYAEMNRLLRTMHFELRARRASLVGAQPALESEGA